MKRLSIGTAHGKPFTLPAELVTTSLAILAKKRVGKSYTTDVFAEEMMEAGMPVGIIDITGAHWGLKSSADGKSAGYPMVIFGGRHADVPLEANAGAIVARAVVEQRFSFILDFSVMSKADMKRFLIAFLEEFYRINQEPFHLICDEADRYAPQQPMGDEIRLVAAMDDIISRGGIKGIGASIVSQRSAKVNKNIVTQCELLVVLRTVHHLDAKTIMDWIEMHATKQEAADMLASLPTIPVGQAWFWWPGEGDSNIFARVSVRKRRTFDSGATPKAGETRAQPKSLAQIDVAKLGADIAATVQRAKDNDPEELKRKVANLERELARKPPAISAPPQRIEVPVLNKHDMHEVEILQGMASDLVKKVENLTTCVTKLHVQLRSRAQSTQSSQASAPPTAHKPAIKIAAAPRAPLETGNHSLGKCPRTLLTVMVQFWPKPVSKNRLALVSGYSLTSSGFANAISELRVAALIEGSGELTCTEAGRAEIGSNYTQLPEGDEAVKHWINKLGKCPSTLLRAMFDNGHMTKQELADTSGYSLTSSGFANGLSELRVLGLIENTNDGRIRIHSEFTT